MIRPAPALVWLVGLCSAPLGIGAAVWPELLPLVALAVFLLAVVCAGRVVRARAAGGDVGIFRR